MPCFATDILCNVQLLRTFRALLKTIGPSGGDIYHVIPLSRMRALLLRVEVGQQWDGFASTDGWRLWRHYRNLFLRWEGVCLLSCRETFSRRSAPSFCFFCCLRFVYPHDVVLLVSRPLRVRKALPLQLCSSSDAVDVGRQNSRCIHVFLKRIKVQYQENLDCKIC